VISAEIGERLSPRTTATLRQFGTRLADGYTKSEIALEFRTSPGLISKGLAEARAELEQLSGCPPWQDPS